MYNLIYRFFLVTFIIFISFNVFAQESKLQDVIEETNKIENKIESPNIILDIPLLNYPFNFSNEYSYPGMQQSLLLSKDWFQPRFPISNS